MRKVYWPAFSKIAVMFIGPEGAGAGAWAWICGVKKGMRVRRMSARGVVLVSAILVS